MSGYQLQYVTYAPELSWDQAKYGTLLKVIFLFSFLLPYIIPFLLAFLGTPT